MSENIAEYYLGLLESATNPATILTQFYTSIAEIKYSNSLLPIMSKLVTLYGRKRVFYAILSISNSNLDDPYKVYGLLAHICKKSLEDSHESSHVIDTSGIEKKLTTKRKLKIEELFNEDTNG